MEANVAVRGAVANLPTKYGTFRIYAYRDVPTGKEHAAIVHGDVRDASSVLARVHSECLTGDVFHSRRCDCGPQLDAALEQIAAAERGVVLYLRQEGRGIGLIEKIRAYALQEEGLDTVDANIQLGHPVDGRSYEAARDILRDLGVRSIRLLTNNPDKIDALRGLGFDIEERVPLAIPALDENRDYLDTKRERMGHMLD